MEIKIKFDFLSEILEQTIKIKKDYDSFKKEIEEASTKIKEALDDVHCLIIIFIVGDGFI